jgi:hypothetical protein
MKAALPNQAVAIPLPQLRFDHHLALTNYYSRITISIALSSAVPQFRAGICFSEGIRQMSET